MGVFFASLLEFNSLIKGNARMNGQLHNTVPECDIEKLKKKHCEGTDIYILPSSKTERERIISILQETGFSDDGKEDIYGKNMYDSAFPLSINFSKKTVSSSSWNVTCAACACSCKVVGSEKEFYYFYNISKNRKGN